MQALKRDFLTTAKAAGLLTLARTRSAGAVRILCYHGLWLAGLDYPGDSMFMRPATFRRRLELIAKLGYTVIPLADAVTALRGDGPALPPSSVVITIDDGWASTATAMWPALETAGMPATLYCDTAQLQAGVPTPHIMAAYFRRIAPPEVVRRDRVALAAFRSATDVQRSIADRHAAAIEFGTRAGLDVDAIVASRTFDYMTPRELGALADRGLDVQLHTHHHSLGDMSPASVAREIDLNRRALAASLGRAPEAFTHFCYPSGVTSAASAASLEHLGLASATTTVQGLAWPGTRIHLLPRLLDGENLSEIEFEAELSGFGDWLRMSKHAAARFARRVPSGQLSRWLPRLRPPSTGVHGTSWR